MRGSDVAVVLSASFIAAHAQAQTPAPQTPAPEELTRRAIERRAVEVVIWGMPAVNYDLMYQALVRARAASDRSSTGAPVTQF